MEHLGEDRFQHGNEKALKGECGQHDWRASGGLSGHVDRTGRRGAGKESGEGTRARSSEEGKNFDF